MTIQGLINKIFKANQTQNNTVSWSGSNGLKSIQEDIVDTIRQRTFFTVPNTTALLSQGFNNAVLCYVQDNAFYRWEPSGIPNGTTIFPANDGGVWVQETIGDTDGTVTSIGISMPAAFTVANSPVTTSGVIGVTANGTSAQYIKGDGTLGTLPTPTGGTVTNVSALTINSTGTDLSSTVANPTTTPVITLSVPTASAVNRGVLSPTDWSTFNGKQDAITLTTTGTSGAATLVGSTLNIPQYQSVITNPVTGTGTSGQVTYWNGTNSVTGSNTFAYTPTSQLLINNSVTASSAIARGTNITPTLIAAANNDVLVGLDINPTFTNGAFTGVQNIGLRVRNTASGLDQITTTRTVVQIGNNSNQSINAVNTLILALPRTNGGGLFIQSNTTSATSSTESPQLNFNNSNGQTFARLSGVGVNGSTGRLEIGVSQPSTSISSGAFFYAAANRGTTQFALGSDFTDNARAVIVAHWNDASALILKPNASTTTAPTLRVRNNADTGDNFLVYGTTGNVIIGATTDAGYKLDVNGTTRFQGSSLVTVGASTSAVSLFNVNITQTGPNALSTTPKGIVVSGTYTDTNTGNNTIFTSLLSVEAAITSTTSTFSGVSRSLINLSPSMSSVGRDLNNSTKIVDVSPSFTFRNVNNITGFYYNPTFTLSGSNNTHRAIETVTGDVYLASTSGNVGIGIAPNSTYKLDVNGNSRISSSGNTRLYLDTTSATPNTGFALSVSGTAKWTVGAYKPSGTNLSYVLYNEQTTTNSLFIHGDTNNVIIGSTTDAGYKLDVGGTTRFQGNITQSSGSATFANGIILDSTSRIFSGGTITYQSNSATSQHLFKNDISSTLSGTIVTITNTSGAFGVANPSNFLNITGRLATSSGTNNLTSILLNHTVENTGTYTGTIRGIYYNPSSIVGTGFTHRAIETVSGDVIFGSTSGNVAIGTTTLGTATRFTLGGSQTASSAIARGGLVNTTLVAAANNDILVGLDVAPTYTNGAFTGVQNQAVRIQGNTVIGATSITNMQYGVVPKLFVNGDAYLNGVLQLGSSWIKINGNNISWENTGITNNLPEWRADATGIKFGNYNTLPLRISIGGTENVRFFSTGNSTFGGTTDAGYKLDVNGSVRSTQFWQDASNANKFQGIINQGGATQSVVGINATRINAQTDLSVGFAGGADASAVIQANSTTKGFLKPRMTTTQRNAIATPATGLEVYNTTTNTEDYYNGTTWVSLQTTTAATKSFGAWQEDTTQTAASSNTGYGVKFSTPDISGYGVNVINDPLGDATYIEMVNNGVYNIQFSLQLQNTDGQIKDVTIWLRKNGNTTADDIPATAGFVSVPNSHGGTPGTIIAAWNYFVEAAAGDFFQLVWSTSDHTRVTIEFYPAGSPPPSAASAILTVNQVN